MKILGIIIIILCFAFNTFVGMFLFGSSLPESEEMTDSSLWEESYDQYGFSLRVPEGFIGEGPRVESNVLDTFYDNTEGDEFDPVLQLSVYGDATEGNITTNDEYKKVSEQDFKEINDTSLDVKYQDGGIMTNANGVKVYYDVISAIIDDKVINQKVATFYHNGNQIQLFWTDDPAGFITSRNEFDKVINSIKTY